MNKRSLMLFALLLMVVFSAGCLKTAGPGEVGIKVRLAGDDRGVDEIPIETGRILYFPVTHQVIVYPTYMQSITYEGVVFNSIEGLRVEADIVIAYSLDPAKVPNLYVTYRAPIQKITNTYLRNSVRSAFVDIASKMTIDDIYGEKKSWLSEQVTQTLRDRLSDVGFNIDYVAFAGDLILPSRIMDSINDKIEATQVAIRTENQLRTAVAEAEKEVAKAEGEARAIMVRAQAEADANRLLVESLGGPENYVRLRMVEKLGDQISVMLLPGESMPLVGLDGLVKPNK